MKQEPIIPLSNLGPKVMYYYIKLRTGRNWNMLAMYPANHVLQNEHSWAA